MTGPYPRHVTIECADCGQPAATGRRLPRLELHGPRLMWHCPHCDTVTQQELPPVARQAFLMLLGDPISTDEMDAADRALTDDAEFRRALDDLAAGRL